MWILTQNRSRILITEGMYEIYVADPIESQPRYAVMLHRKIDGKPFGLGFYEKREYAIMVIKDIIDKQSMFYSCQGGQDLTTGGFQPAFAIVPPKTYKMPFDDNDYFEKRMNKIRQGKEDK